MIEASHRKVDRQRRQRVIDGAIEAIAIYGVEGLTHRRAAEVAGVPRSATTYYFTSLEELLEAAMREAMERDLAAVRERFDAVAQGDLPETLATYVADAAGAERRDAIVIAELYVAALRREHLRELAAAWDRAWIDLLTPLVGAAAEGVPAAIGGLMMRALLFEGDSDPAQTAAMIRALLERDGS